MDGSGQYLVAGIAGGALYSNEVRLQKSMLRTFSSQTLTYFLLRLSFSGAVHGSKKSEHPIVLPGTLSRFLIRSRTYRRL
jgi:hypothetical protein